MRRVVTALGIVALVAVLVVGLSQAGGGEPTERRPVFDIAEAQQQLRGAPSALAGLHAQASEVLDGGLEAFERRLRALRGTPVVVNKWASWCAPCRAEFPIFQHVSTDLGKEIAFLGISSRDTEAGADSFLARYPVPFPTYFDPDQDIARAYEAGNYFPMTIFIDADGEVAYVHPGQYKTTADLVADIDRYL